MVRYSKEPDNITKAAKARASYLRVHYKHCREIAHAIKGLKLKKAQTYLSNVLQYKEAIPYTKYTGGIGRHAAGKQHKAPGDKVSWPQKATKSFLDLLRNIEANAEVAYAYTILIC
jgi:large subunit ribosomal protein L17e